MPETETTPEPKPAPINVVAAVEKYIADVMAKADDEGEHVAAKIIDQQRKVAQLNIALLRIKEGEKTIKGRLELEVETLDDLQKQAEYEATQAAPLFDDPSLRSKPVPTAEDFRAEFNALTLADLGISGAMADKLEADGIKTGEHLQKWFAEHPPRKIRGIGDGARDKINDLMAKWFESRLPKADEKPSFDSEPTKPRVYSPAELGVDVLQLREADALPALQQAKGESRPDVKPIDFAFGKGIVLLGEETDEATEFIVYPLIPSCNVLAAHKAAIDAIEQPEDTLGRFFGVEVLINGGEVYCIGPDADAITIRCGAAQQEQAA